MWNQPSAINDAMAPPAPARQRCQNLAAAATPWHHEHGRRQKAFSNLGIYPANSVPQADTASKTRTGRAGRAKQGNSTSSYPEVDWFNVDMPIACKSDDTERDPVDESEPNGEPTTDRRTRVREDLLACTPTLTNQRHRPSMVNLRRAAEVTS